MPTVYVEYGSTEYNTLLAHGWLHWCNYVDEQGRAMMVQRI